jgi:hypothetical protein
MKRLMVWMMTVAMVVLGGASMAAQHKVEVVSVAGKWLLKMADGPHGPSEMPLSIKQEGAKLTAVLVPPGHGAEFTLTGEIKGHELTLSIPASDNNMAFQLKATVQADGTLKGYTSSEMGDSVWVATRVKQ